MTPEEKDALNRRVAVALSIVPKQLPDSKMWAYDSPTNEYSTVLFWVSEEKAWELCPDFCTDPDACALVLEAITARGWNWEAESNHGVQGGYSCRLSSIAEGDLVTGYHWGDTPWIAFCLAFLAAHDAEQEAKK